MLLKFQLEVERKKLLIESVQICIVQRFHQIRFEPSSDLPGSIESVL